MNTNTDYYKVFKELLNEYGEQNWWPAESDWEMMVGAILVQNTSWSNVEKSIENLKLSTLFSPHKISNLRYQELIDHIKPSGFYKAKSNTIRSLFSFFEDYHFDIRKIDDTFNTKELRKELLKIKGIGPETADDILLYVFNRPIFIADLYARRLFAFIENKDINTITYNSLKTTLEPKLAEKMSVKELQEFHALIDEFAMEYINKKDNG
ncbi:endonuclease III [Latilactobacillus sakei]